VYTTVTIPIDTDDPAVEAIEIATALAGRLGAGVELVTVASPGAKTAKAELLEALSTTATVPVSTRVLVSKDVGGELLGEVVHHPSSLWCVPTHARSAAFETFLGSVSEDLVRDSGQPVVLIGKRAVRRVGDGGVILVTVDADHTSTAILPIAVELARALRLGLRLVEVIDPAKVPAEMRSDESNLVHNLAKDWSTEHLVIEFEVLHGSRPATAIVDYANTTSDVVLIAMTSHGVPASARMVVPSETFRVVRKALCPVIALHPLPGLPRAERGIVVAGVDRLATSAEVVDFAIAEASRRGAQLLLLHTWEEQIYVGEMGVAYTTTGPDDSEEAHLTRMDEVVAAAKAIVPELEVNTVVSRGWAADILVDYSKIAELIIVGHHEHHGFGEKVFGSTARSLMRRAWCPVVVVPCAAHADDGVGKPENDVRKVVVGTDGSPLADVAMAWAHDTCARWGTDLTVVHSWDYPYQGIRTPVSEGRDLVALDAATALRDAVDRLRASKGDAVRIHAELREGIPRDELHAEAADADLIVVGSHGRSAIGRMVLGSVSASLVEHPPCPVAVIRAPFADS
jgi:nucleotide-binding universal stress UspA family protein